MHSNKLLLAVLQGIDLGSSVAEEDTILEEARIETSTFTDLMLDRVDLIPGTKGSGKSSLFRIFVDFLPRTLLRQRKVIIAHGVNAPGDPVFHAFNDQFSKLSEQEFISFWCIYLVSLAQEQFIKAPQYNEYLTTAQAEVKKFRETCAKAKIPEIASKKSLKDILLWSLNVLASWKPNASFKPPGEVGEFTLNLFGDKTEIETEKTEDTTEFELPSYVNEIKSSLEGVLIASKLSLWLMVDRLDEIFPRRSEVERKALRGLLRAMRYFASSSIRVKLFLRDDMLEQLVNDEEGFTALTHITARQADTLRWTDDQILSMVVKRFVVNDYLVAYLKISKEKTEASAAYREECFSKIFPPTVFKGEKQSRTIRWLCDRCADGRGVVTPRDILDLLIRAKQKQQDLCGADPEGQSDYLIGAVAIKYGFEELSKRKRDTYLRAEFPHLWKDMDKFSGGKTDYDEAALQELLGRNWKAVAEHLVSIGFLSLNAKGRSITYSIPLLYFHGMNLTRGSA